MPRPKRPRNVFSKPKTNGFVPENGYIGEPVILTHEEFEAIRMIDYQGMDQSQTAQMMNVSRQTVGRILKIARYKMSQTMVEGRSLKIQGGCYRMRKGHGHGRGNSCKDGRGRRKRHGQGRGSGRLD